MSDRTPPTFYLYLSQQIDGLRDSHQQLGEGLAYAVNELKNLREEYGKIVQKTNLEQEKM